MSFLPYRFLLALVCCACLSACGGGGGDGGNVDNTPDPVVPPAPQQLSGGASLGLIQAAIVTVIGSQGEVLATGLTDALGQFGPIDIPGDYIGPLLIEISPAQGGESTWICDYYQGCQSDAGLVDFGAQVPFDVTLKAVVASVEQQQQDDSPVYVSLLSHLAVERAQALGGLTAENIQRANRETAAAIRSLLGGMSGDIGSSLPDQIYSVPLVDFTQDNGDTDGAATLLSLLNASLIGLLADGATLPEFVQGLSGKPLFPVSSTDPSVVSVERVLEALTQHVEVITEDEGLVELLNDQLETVTLEDVKTAAQETLQALPAIVVSDQISVTQMIDDTALVEEIRQVFILQSDNGEALEAETLEAVVDEDWVNARVIESEGQAVLELSFPPAQLDALSHGLFTANLRVYSTEGDRKELAVTLSRDVDIRALIAWASTERSSAWERSEVSVQGSVSRPSLIDSVSWEQLSGEDADIAEPNELTTRITLASVSALEVAVFSLTVTDIFGNEARSDVRVTVQPYTNISDLVLPDATFQQCITQAGEDHGLEDVAEFTALSCSGVGDYFGVTLFPNLTSLTLTDSTLTSLDTLLNLPELEYVDISGNTQFSCSEVKQLAEQLVLGSTLIAEDACRAIVDLDLGGSGFDIAMDYARQQAYVSIPTRNEVAVISLESLRIVDRFLLQGSPRGIDLSLDGEHLFVALYGSNAVAKIDIDQRSVSNLDLDDATGNALTYDVVEGEPDRLFVTAAPGSGGFSYVAEIRLDQNAAVSRVADNRIIRASPVLARSPDSLFVYTGEGFSPNSLYKLSLNDPDAGIVLEDDHGSVSGTNNLTLNATGTRIALRSGQVLRTGSFIEEGRIPSGYNAAATESDSLMLADAFGVVDFYDFESLELTRSTEARCSIGGSPEKLRSFNADQDFVLMRQNQVCLSADSSLSTPADPYPQLQFPDSAFETCVRTSAELQGVDTPEEIAQLDCSESTRNILSLEGIDRLVKLQQLDISGSGVFDLTPLQGLSTLQNLSAQNSAIGTVTPLMDISTLIDLDITGNVSIACVDLNTLSESGVTVVADQCTEHLQLELGGIGFDMEVNANGDKAYISVPSLQVIAEVDVNTLTVSQQWAVSGEPRGIDLSQDGTTLYTALNSIGSVAYLDTATGSEEVVDLLDLLDDGRTYDVAEVSQDRIVVSSSPGSNGFAYIVEVLRDQGNQAQRVASNTIIRATPTFASNSGQTFVYVGSGFSPNSLYRLDASDADLPIVLEDNHGSVSGATNLALSPDGARIYLSSGQVLESSTFNQLGQLPAGRALVAQDNNTVFVADSGGGSIGVYDAETFRKIGSRGYQCSLTTVNRMAELGSAGMLLMGDDLVCASRVVDY
jgi:K319L-like, PKD domain